MTIEAKVHRVIVSICAIIVVGMVAAAAMSIIQHNATLQLTQENDTLRHQNDNLRETLMIWGLEWEKTNVTAFDKAKAATEKFEEGHHVTPVYDDRVCNFVRTGEVWIWKGDGQKYACLRLDYTGVLTAVQLTGLEKK